MNISSLILAIALGMPTFASAKEVALSFDDAPKASSFHYTSSDRTSELIRKLTDLRVPQAMVFANPCNGGNVDTIREQLRKYVEAGHLVGNHTCSHPRFDEVGYKAFSEDAKKADDLLGPLFKGQKFFRFPFLNEGKDPVSRDKMRGWLKTHGYRNASISGDNEDPTFSSKINEAKRLGKKIDYEAVKASFIDHIVSALECNDGLAVANLGRSPKHVLLLHEADATVMYVDSLIVELRKHGWKIISATEAYTDGLYLEEPKNTYSGYGIVAQVAFEKTGKKKSCYDYPALVRRLNDILGLKK